MKFKVLVFLLAASSMFSLQAIDVLNKTSKKVTLIGFSANPVVLEPCSLKTVNSKDFLNELRIEAGDDIIFETTYADFVADEFFDQKKFLTIGECEAGRCPIVKTWTLGIAEK